MIVFPNAKINLGLNIIEKRADGYHNIESVFYPLMEVFDVLEIIESEQLIFSSSGLSIPGDIDDNLCLKAYRLIKTDFNIPNVHIHLHKVIPMGAGMGGGSSDAAFLLKALNQLFKLNVTNAGLRKYAVELGSDCAFFIDNQPAFAFGKGDELELIHLDLNKFEIKVEYPNIHIGTAQAYSGVTPKKSVVSCKEVVQQDVFNWKNRLKNDFEDSVFKNYPQILEVKEKFYSQGAIYASMTGSGSAVYGLFKR